MHFRQHPPSTLRSEHLKTRQSPLAEFSMHCTAVGYQGASTAPVHSVPPEFVLARKCNFSAVGTGETR